MLEIRYCVRKNELKKIMSDQEDDKKNIIEEPSTSNEENQSEVDKNNVLLSPQFCSCEYFKIRLIFI